MRTLRNLFFLMLIVPVIFTAGCREEDDPTPANPIEESAFTIMTDYMIDEGLDFTDVTSSWITARPETADDIPAFLANRYVIDLRSATDFAAGHIENAVNSTLANVVTTAAGAGDKQILVVCYTGQTAGHATVALRLSGYTNAQVLKWGMSGWSKDLDKWTPNLGSGAVGHENWLEEANPAARETFEYPDWTSTSTDPATILAERVQFMLTNGFKGVNSADVYGTPSNYFINNFWAEADNTHYGHIVGAYRIQPMSLANEDFKAYDPDKPCVSYCWTGQTSSMLTAYLAVLGYDALSLKFGSNSMIYDALESHKFSAPGVDYPVVTD